MGVAVGLVCQSKLGPLAWALAGAFVAVLAAILRVAFAYGGLVADSAGVDCFATQGLHGYTYLLFALSGAVAGACIYWVGENPVFAALGVLGVVLGVLYHLKIAEGWWTGRVVVQQILFLGEFLAPAVFALVLAKPARMVLR